MFKAIRTSRQPVVLGYLLVMFVSVLSACAKPDITTVPAHPSYELDVKPLLADHCLLCHSYPATRGAPTSFRLDVYATSGRIAGARDEAPRFINSVLSNKMPPAALWGEGVGANGEKLLQNWQIDGYPDYPTGSGLDGGPGSTDTPVSE
ncbi:MAG: hypothetical protein ABSB49_11210 [Polyangia bacterium]|jgi:hypothetical protein